MRAHRERRVKDERNGRAYDDRRRKVHQKRSSDGEAARIAQGWQRALPAPFAHWGGLVAIRLSPPRRWSIQHAEDRYDRRVARS